MMRITHGLMLKQGLQLESKPSFVPVGYDNAIFVANGVDAPWHYEGTTATDISGTKCSSLRLRCSSLIKTVYLAITRW